MNKIKVNYITDIEKIKSITDDFFKNIPKNQHYKYVDNLDNQILQKIPKKIINRNNTIIKKANFLLNKYLENDLKKNNVLNEWNICLTNNNFMFNFPFTLDNIIFMPLKYNISNNDDELITTFIHEQIHIYQRFNLKEWNEYILKNTKWRLCKIKLIKNMIYNPDTFYKKYSYCYVLNNVKYYCFLNKSFDLEWIDEDNMVIYNEKNLPNYEHPFEELAYTLSKDISKK